MRLSEGFVPNCGGCLIISDIESGDNLLLTPHRGIKFRAVLKGLSSCLTNSDD